MRRFGTSLLIFSFAISLGVQARDVTGRAVPPPLTDDRQVPAAGSQAKAIGGERTFVQIILDASGSMLEEINGESKINTAKKMIKVAIQSIDAGNSITSLRTFGHRRPHDCKDIELRLGFYEKNLSALNERVLEIQPAERGMTPLAKALEQAAEDFKDHPGPKRIIAITDGVETCGGDPCKAAEKLRKEYDVKVYVLTYGAKKEDDFSELNCVGKTQNAKSPEAFAQALSDLTMEALNTKQTIVVRGPKPEAWATAEDVTNRGRQFRFVSSLGVPLPPGTFDVTVDYEPPVAFKAVRLGKNEHKVLNVQGAGTVRLVFPSPQVKMSAENLVTGKHYVYKANERGLLPAGRYNLLATTPTGLAFQYPSVSVTPRGRVDLPVPNWGILHVPDAVEQPYDLFPAKALSPGVSDTLVPVEHRPVQKVTAFADSLGFYMTNQDYVVEVGRYRVMLKSGREYTDVQVKQGKKTVPGQ